MAGTDIFADWKLNKFAVFENNIIMMDFAFWSNHYNEIIEWAEKHGGSASGLVITFKDQQMINWFLLRWG